VNAILEHFRNKLLAGTFAMIPIALVIYIAYWVEQNTKAITAPLGYQYPGLGFLIVMTTVYLLGVVVTSFIGQWFLGMANWAMEKVPGFNLIYRAWKDILVLPPEKTGMFHKVVLVPTAEQGAQLGFTSFDPLPADPDSICVLLPNIPSPFSGRLLIVKKSVCVPVNMTVEEALKYQLSTGNYLPKNLVAPNPN
jgi:uncharacterized membrane protein